MVLEHKLQLPYWLRFFSDSPKVAVQLVLEKIEGRKKDMEDFDLGIFGSIIIGVACF